MKLDSLNLRESERERERDSERSCPANLKDTRPGSPRSTASWRIEARSHVEPWPKTIHGCQGCLFRPFGS